jgi:hypothetical protein
MPNKKLPFVFVLNALVVAVLACAVLPGGVSPSGLQATANAALTQAAGAAGTAGAQGSALSATAAAAGTQAIATANAAGATQPTAAATPASTSDNAASGPKDVPLIDPHTVVSASAQELTYNTTADVQTVAKFYEDQMPKLGWAAQGTPFVTDSVAKMSFDKTGQIVTIGISVDPKSRQTVVGVIVE